MERVASDSVVIVTHGRPEIRSPIFKKHFTEDKWTETIKQCELSFQAQFINIVRSNFPNVPINTVIKDPAKLAKCLKEAMEYKKSKTSSGNVLRQSMCWIYIYKLIPS